MPKGKGNPKAAEAMRLHQRTGISLKAAWARVRGGHGGTTKHQSSGGKNPGGSSKGKMGLGAAYLNAQMGQRIASPLIDEGIRAVQLKALPSGSQLVTDLKQKAVGTPYAINVGIAVGDRWLDKKTGQANALSHGSVTALAPEVYDIVRVIDDARNKVPFREMHTRYTIRNSAYNPAAGKTDTTYGFWEKRFLKHGGQIVRMLANRTGFGSRITEPIKKHVLAPLGMRA